MQAKKIIIAGAGLVGLSFALCAAEQNVHIEILETHLPDFSNHHSNEKNNRPISLSFGSYRILKSLGIWDALENVACPILSVHVSEKNRLGFTKFLAIKEKVPALGFVVPLNKLQAALYQKMAAQTNITFTAIQSINKIITDVHHAEIFISTVDGEKKIYADLLVAADGTHSHCRDLLKIVCDEKSSDEAAFIYQLQLSENHTNTAYERFTKSGVLAVLPLTEKNRAQLVWTRRCECECENVLEFLQNTFEGRLSIASVKKISEFPLQTIIAQKQIAPSAVVIGNAAHTIYPVAAQGFNLGLRDAAILSELLRENFSTALSQYEKKVQPHQQAIYKITQQLVSIFELPLISYARGLGLLTTDLISSFKNKLAKRMMGIAQS